MRAEFKILTHLNENCLHLKLVGNFDCVSARHLIGLLRRYVQKVSTVIIHTSSVTRIPFAQDEFRNALLSLQKQPVRFIFTGEHASLFC
ncbi:MAG: hypothetical protein QG552_2609 [Thermodesulfobacteriota bacterium]|nr:hypothetical protein [Thermodesulfobacteriota bacterium]